MLRSMVRLHLAPLPEMPKPQVRTGAPPPGLVRQDLGAASGWRRRCPSGAVGPWQDGDCDLLEMTCIQERRVRGCERSAATSADLGRHAVRQADRTTCPVVATSAKAAGRCGQLAINHDGVVKTQLREIEAGLLFIGASEPNEVVDHLGDSDRRERTAGVDEPFDFASGRFVLEEGKYRVGVEDRQRRPVRSVSSRRDSRRARLVVGPCFAYLPRSSPTGSAPTGRMTTRSPRSTTRTCRVFHRARVSAGIETWPFRDTVIKYEVSLTTTLYSRRLALYTGGRVPGYA